MSETMTEKPDDISQESWDEARHALSIGFTVPIKRRDVVVSVAQALSAAEARGRDAAADIAANFQSDGNPQPTIQGAIAAAIRKGLTP